MTREEVINYLKVYTEAPQVFPRCEVIKAAIKMLEQPLISEDHETAAEKWANTTHFGWPNQVPAGKKGFIAGAKWQWEQMMEKAVEGEVIGYDDGTGKFITVLEDLPDDSPYKVHDKVKLIIIPEEK